MQRTRVRSLVQENSMFCGATKARAPQPLGPCVEPREPTHLGPVSTWAGTTGAHAPGACVHLSWDHGSSCTWGLRSTWAGTTGAHAPGACVPPELDHGSPCTWGLHSTRAGTTGAHAPGACVPLEKPLWGEAQVPQEEYPCSPQPEEACAATKTQHSQKVKLIFKTHQTLL